MEQSPFYLLRIPSFSIGDLGSLSYLHEEGHDFDDQVIQIQKNLLELAAHEDLLNGLQFSSQLFLKSLLKLKKKSIASLKKKDRQIQRRLLEYLHRMLFNASPFSSFASVQLLDHDFQSRKPKQPFSIHFNKKIWSLVDDLILESDERDFDLLVRKSPFLEESEKSILYLYIDQEKVQTVSYTHLTLPTICSV